MNAVHSSMKITDEFYSNLTNDEVEKRIDSLSKTLNNIEENNTFKLFTEFMTWKTKQENDSNKKAGKTK
jgi:hypothetical protein